MDFPTPKPKNHFSDRSPNLLTNCDLPPPLHLFSPFFFDDDNNHSVLRALHLSQSRAREAEERFELATAKSTQLASMLLDQSLRLSVHRRWAMMLEFEVAALRKRLSQPDDDEDDGPVEIAWCLAFALCVGIAGVGFAIGRCLF